MKGLNQKDLQILRLTEKGGEQGILAADIRAKIDGVENTAQSTYRLNKLEDVGAIETEHRFVDDLPVRQRAAAITDSGRALLEDEPENLDEFGDDRNEELDELREEIQWLEIRLDYFQNEVLPDSSRERKKIAQRFFDYFDENESEYEYL